MTTNQKPLNSSLGTATRLCNQTKSINVGAKPLVSVIVPCFNSAPYLERCLSSLMHNAEPRLQFLVINDGSTDATQSIALSFATKDSRFKVVEKLNGGYPSAINTGIQISDAEYVLFLGSDDELSLGFLDILVGHLEEHHPDVCAFRTDVIEDGSFRYSDPVTSGIQSLVLYSDSFRNLTEAYPEESAILSTRDTSRCYKKSAIGSWREHGRYGIDADGTFSILVCLGCSNFSFLPVDGYIWHRRSDGLSGSRRTREKQLDVTLNWLDFFKQLRENYRPESYPSSVYNYVWVFLGNAYQSACMCGKEGLETNALCRKEYYAFNRHSGGLVNAPLKVALRLWFPRLYRNVKKLFGLFKR